MPKCPSDQKRHRHALLPSPPLFYPSSFPKTHIKSNSNPMHPSKSPPTCTYSNKTANAAATAPTLYATRLPAPVVSAGAPPVLVALGATLGPPVCVGTVEFPPFVDGIAEPVLAAPPPLALAVITVVKETTVPFAFVSLELQRMESSCTGLVAMRAGVVLLKRAEPASLPAVSLKAWQVRLERDTSVERRSSRPQTDLSSVWGVSACVLVGWGMRLLGGLGDAYLWRRACRCRW